MKFALQKNNHFDKMKIIHFLLQHRKDINYGAGGWPEMFSASYMFPLYLFGSCSLFPDPKNVFSVVWGKAYEVGNPWKV